jgi:2-methylcitrate dehydratase PrpD
MANRAVTPALARFCAGLRFEDLPADVVERTRWCVLDAVGNMLAGARSPLAHALLGAVGNVFAPGPATVVGLARRLAAPGAALVNGMLGDLFEFQDGWRDGNVHPSVVIPAALATAEWQTATGRAFLTAVVVGYEVTNRLAWAVAPGHIARGHLPTGTLGACGSAATAARLLGGDDRVVASALGLAGMLLPVSTVMNVWGGFSGKPLIAAHAARAGVEAAVLALAGFDAGSLEGVPADPRGVLQTLSDVVRLERVLEDLGTRFTVRDVYFKLVPACRHAHGSIEAALAIAQRASYRVEDIVAVRVDTYALAASHLARAPDAQAGFVASQYSIPFVVATALVRGALTLDDFAYGARPDPAVLALARSVVVETDAEIDRRYPDEDGARIEVRLADGRVLRHEVRMALGDPRRGPIEDALMAKFLDAASPVLGAAPARRLADAVLSIDAAGNVADVFAPAAGR